MEKFTFFFTRESLFSQWYPCLFVVDGQTFCCTEQFMMHGKAVLFEDTEIAAEILVVTEPGKHKALGRKVRGFDDRVWRVHREGIVAAGNRAKFTQNSELLDALLATAGTTLVEASPFDRIWGIGIGASNPAALDRKTWKGKNLLGQILTSLRDELTAAR
jgi:ribA/ribD-fused uncharacterized protein